MKQREFDDIEMFIDDTYGDIETILEDCRLDESVIDDVYIEMKRLIRKIEEMIEDEC